MRRSATRTWFPGGVCVEYGKEDFCHVRQRSGVDFNGFALFVCVVEEFAFEDLFAHLDANLVGDPS